MFLRAVVVLPWTLGIASASCATSDPIALGELRPGEAVRVIHDFREKDAVLTRRLIRQINGSIEVSSPRDSTRHRIHLLEIDGLQVIRGRARPKGALAGSIAGGVGGIVAGMICHASCPENEKGKRYLAPLLGFAIMAPIGAVAGAFLAPVRWVDVKLR